MSDVVLGQEPHKPAEPAERALTMEAKMTRDQIVRVVAAADVGQAPPRVVSKPAGPALAPELRKALLESFRRNEAAYRYLGR